MSIIMSTFIFLCPSIIHNTYYVNFMCSRGLKGSIIFLSSSIQTMWNKNTSIFTRRHRFFCLLLSNITKMYKFLFTPFVPNSNDIVVFKIYLFNPILTLYIFIWRAILFRIIQGLLAERIILFVAVMWWREV